MLAQEFITVFTHNKKLCWVFRPLAFQVRDSTASLWLYQSVQTRQMPSKLALRELNTCLYYHCLTWKIQIQNNKIVGEQGRNYLPTATYSALQKISNCNPFSWLETTDVSSDEGVSLPQQSSCKAGEPRAQQVLNASCHFTTTARCR